MTTPLLQISVFDVFLDFACRHTIYRFFVRYHWIALAIVCKAHWSLERVMFHSWNSELLSGWVRCVAGSSAGSSTPSGDRLHSKYSGEFLTFRIIRLWIRVSFSEPFSKMSSNSFLGTDHMIHWHSCLQVKWPHKMVNIHLTNCIWGNFRHCPKRDYSGLNWYHKREIGFTHCFCVSLSCVSSNVLQRYVLGVKTFNP